MSRRLIRLVDEWCEILGIDQACRPDQLALIRGFPRDSQSCRPGIDTCELDAWEYRYGYRLPLGLRTWLNLSDGLFLSGPIIHPLSAIGPMIPFAQVPDLLVQPESWFELGNPNRETICLDLGYRRPNGGTSVFTSGDDEQHSLPRIIAASFDEWFLRLLCEGGFEYWFAPGFQDLGDPWCEHCRYVPRPDLTESLRPIASHVMPMLQEGLNDRAIAARFGISSFDVEAIIRHLQHTHPLPPQPVQSSF